MDSIVPITSEPTTDGEREAKLAADGDIQLGVGIYLTPDQLRTLGVDPKETDTVTYEVDAETQRVVIKPVDEEDED